MLTRVRAQFGNAGLVVAIVALLAALGGGAYAASSGSSDGKATASAKGKQGPRGPKGPKGPMGPMGPAGPAGPAGPKGDTGSKGETGASGAAGTSVTSTTLPKGNPKCAEGGSEFTAANGATVACNGAKGAAGPAGPPGPSCNEEGECLLPVGATQTGIWAVKDKGTPGIYLTISFPLRLPGGAPGAPEVHYVTAEQITNETAPDECPGSVEDPKAVSPAGDELGQLCLYESFRANLNAPGFFFNPDPRGGAVTEFALVDESEVGEAVGSWAVTPPSGS